MTLEVQKTPDLIRRQVRDFFDMCHLRVWGILDPQCHLRVKSEKTKVKSQKCKRQRGSEEKCIEPEEAPQRRAKACSLNKTQDQSFNK